MFVKFYYNPVEIGVDDETGLPVFEDQVFIIINRDTTHTMNRKAKEEDFGTFPEHYKAFQNAHQDYMSVKGFPLEMWAALRPAQVHTLKAHGITTVEVLARSEASKMPGDYAPLVKLAKQFIQISKDTSASATRINDLTSQLEDVVEENKTLRAEVGRLKEALTAKV